MCHTFAAMIQLTFIWSLAHTSCGVTEEPVAKPESTGVGKNRIKRVGNNKFFLRLMFM